jgi:hypothetical protein
MEREYSVETLGTLYQNTRFYNTSTMQIEAKFPSSTLAAICKFTSYDKWRIAVLNIEEIKQRQLIWFVCV